ncbi:VOC family protein [Streptomyces sp. SBT349]|uniref:VOC family protein n=1 Tax=Streptomyces sp. SBT349 TaxID=1580539 RepID=UPI00066C2A09|nr:VOC family protein [Streptomyces sp. SBT349]
MPEPTSYRPGALCWADLNAPEPAAAEEFYAAVLGWEYVHAGPAFDHYTYATARRQMVAGIAPGEQGSGSWIVSFATDDADATAGRITGAGGRIADGPRDFGVQGRSLLAIDTAGAHVGFWQPRAHMGAGLLGEPAALCWAELAVHDGESADRFYESVLGFRAAEHAEAATPGYAAFRLSDGRDDTAVAGRTLLRPDQPGVDPFWMPYFGVTDTGKAATTAAGEGGSVLHRSTDAIGRGLAVVADPWGATFAVLELPSRA